MVGTNKSGGKEFLRHISSKVNSLALAILFLPLLVYGAKGISIENSVVDRVATEVTLSFDGKIISYNTNSFDIKNALEEKGVSVGEFDVVEPSLSTKLTGGEVVVKIKRAERFLLDDDGRKSFIFSAYEEPRKILEQNKIKFFPEDKIYFDLIFDFYGDDSLGKKIILKRAPILYVNVDGEKKELHSWKSTVSEALEEKGILVGEKDRVTPDRETFVTNKIEVTIVRVAESEVKEMEIIPFDTQIINDYFLEIGKSYIKQEGINGEKENVYKIISENGVMVSKTLISSQTVTNPKKEIVVKGLKPYKAGDWWGTIVDAALKFGVDPQKMYNVMLCESGGNPYAGYYHKGLFQYSPDTWMGASSAYPGGVYASAAITDGVAQIYVTAWKASRQGWGAWGCQ